ncbi:MAG: zinc ribbon domain-containing protein [Vicinamibacteraceae bacterium]
MVCQNCGTEIADKAIVCFRCGQATVAAVRKPAPPSSRLRGVFSLIALVLLALAALFLGQAGTIDVPPAVRYSVMAAAIVLLMWRLIARRR